MNKEYLQPIKKNNMQPKKEVEKNPVDVQKINDTKKY